MPHCTAATSGIAFGAWDTAYTNVLCMHSCVALWSGDRVTLLQGGSDGMHIQVLRTKTGSSSSGQCSCHTAVA